MAHFLISVPVPQSFTDPCRLMTESKLSIYPNCTHVNCSPVPYEPISSPSSASLDTFQFSFPFNQFNLPFIILLFFYTCLENETPSCEAGKQAKERSNRDIGMKYQIQHCRAIEFATLVVDGMYFFLCVWLVVCVVCEGYV